jgi:hypothetical protein
VVALADHVLWLADKLGSLEQILRGLTGHDRL